MSIAAGEPIVIGYQPCTADKTPESLTGRVFTLSIYVSAQTEALEKIDSAIATDAGGEYLYWAITGKRTAKLFGLNLKYEISERLDDGRDVVVQGTLTINESAPGVVDYDSAPTTRYINRVYRYNDPETIETPRFEVKTKAFGSVPTAPVFSAQPTISGTATVGSTLTGNDGQVTNGSVTSRQWLRNGVVVDGATGSTYAIGTDHQGATIAFRVTATGSGGTVTATSQAVTVAAATAPSFTIAPTITGTSTAGELLTCQPGQVVNGSIAGYQWLKDGATISGATQAQYRTVWGDATHAISVRVTATGAGGSVNATSPTVSIVAGAPIFTARPVISGTPAVGQTLTATTGVAEGATGSVGRAWYAGSNWIFGSVTDSLTITDAMVGKAITHRVTMSNAQGATTSISDPVTIQGAGLQKLTLSAPLARGVAATVNILNATAGTTITGTVPGMTLDSAARTLTGTPTDLALMLTESDGTKTKNTLMYSHDPKKKKMRLGMGMAGVANYSANNVFLDNFKVALIYRHPATSDANGMPLTLSPDPGDGNRPAAIYVMPLPDGTTNAVKWRLITDGDLDVEVKTYNGFDARMMTKEGNDLVFSYNGPASTTKPEDRHFLWLTIRAVRVAPTKMALVRDDEAADYLAGKIFRPAFKTEIKKFSWVRMMNWSGANWLEPANVPESYLSYMGQGSPLKGGVPLSVQVKLCLEAGVSGWFNHHITISDNGFTAAMVEMDKVRAAGHDVYCELSNEVWNGQFYQYTYATQQGKAMGYGVENTYLANLEWYGYRVGQLAKLSRGKGYKWGIGCQPVNQDYQPDFVLRSFDDSGAANTDVFMWITTNYASGTLSLQPETLPAGLDDKQRQWMRDRDYDAAIYNVVSEPWAGGYGIPNVARYQVAAVQVGNSRGWKTTHYESNVYHCNSVPYVVALEGYEEVFYQLPNHSLSRGATLVNAQVAEDSGVWGSTLFDFDSAPNSSEYGVFGHYGRATYLGLMDWIDQMDTTAVVTPPIGEPEPEPTLPGYRYWRVKPTENVSENPPGGQYFRWGAAEIVFRDATGIIDSSTFTPTTPADSAGNPVARVFDVALDASWLTKGTDATDASKAVLNIDATKSIRPTSIEWYVMSGLEGFGISTGVVEASNDGQTWVTLATMTQRLTYSNGKAVIALVYA